MFYVKGGWACYDRNVNVHDNGLPAACRNFMSMQREHQWPRAFSSCMSQFNPENAGVTAAKTASCFAEKDARVNRLTEELHAAKAETERAKRRSGCLASANHDLRQPLQTICFIQGMLANTVSDPAARNLIERLDQAVVAMSQILDRLVEMDRQEHANSTGDAHPMQAMFEGPALQPLPVIRASETPQSD